MKRIGLFFSLFILYNSLMAQNNGLGVYLNNYRGIWTNQGGEWYNGGNGLTLEYERALNKIKLTAGLEMRSINWGNEASILLGIKNNFLDRPKFQLRGSCHLGFGLALFRPYPLFQTSIDYIPEFKWKLGKGNNLSFGLGFRYTLCPEYKNYGTIFQLMELPILVGWSKNF